MHELEKVNTQQVFLMWRNVAVPVLTVIFMHVLTNILPSILAPVVSTVTAIVLYYQVISNSYSKEESCAICPYIFFITIVSYTISLIILNILTIWGLLRLPDEFIFFDGQFIMGLVLSPVGLITTFIMYLNRRHLTLCINCKITAGSPSERGRIGNIYNSESNSLMKDIMLMYSILIVINYGYYLYEYIDLNISERDTFVFRSINILIYLFLIAKYAIHYYNLFLDLKESNELLSPDELSALGTRTYVRFYVICGDSLYMSVSNIDNQYDDETDIIDSPFSIRRNASGFQEYELKQFIEEQTGIKGGELRFFYGRKLPDAAGRKVLRYFYFIPGEPEDYPELRIPGSWISSDKLKTIYNNTPDRLTSVCLSDISRLAMITITSKLYKPNGERRNKLTQYRPSFTLREIKTDNLDYQNDKWIRVANFNSDTSFFKVKRWWRRRFRNAYYENN
ncbi:MAG: hypothetical protein NC217_02370 [Muribaculaceae bacterium]|nr:hypothetical protein [Muribaculaceae bacterium]